jgi:hypothetical protein
MLNCSFLRGFVDRGFVESATVQPRVRSGCRVIGGNQVSRRNFDVAIASIDIYHFYKIKNSVHRGTHNSFSTVSPQSFA